MKKVIKWVAICGGGLIVLIILALLLIPMFVDVQKYKPVIEEKVAESTGRSFTIGDDLSLSLFPWAGISFSNLHFGNPSGFQEKDFITVKSFEVRVKLLPLISRDIQVKRFILEGARIVLEKNKDGLGNWEGLGGPPGETVPKPTKEKESCLRPAFLLRLLPWGSSRSQDQPYGSITPKESVKRSQISPSVSRMFP